MKFGEVRIRCSSYSYVYNLDGMVIIDCGIFGNVESVWRSIFVITIKKGIVGLTFRIITKGRRFKSRKDKENKVR